MWASMREGCQKLADKEASGQHLEQREFGVAQGCGQLSDIHINPYVGSSTLNASTTPEGDGHR